MVRYSAVTWASGVYLVPRRTQIAGFLSHRLREFIHSATSCFDKDLLSLARIQLYFASSVVSHLELSFVLQYNRLRSSQTLSR